MTDIEVGDEAQRAAICDGLRALASFLEAHKELPLPVGMSIGPHLSGTDEEERAEVDRIAAILGAPVDVSGRDTHYSTSRDFGGTVAYRAVAIRQAEMDAYNTHMDFYAGPSRRNSQRPGTGEVKQ